MRRDEKTLYAMASIYCKDHHRGDSSDSDKVGNRLDDQGLCCQCAETVAYSIERTKRCPNEHKGNCEDCDIHCYRPEERARIREIMAYAGPRMFTKHPIMTFFYLKKKFARKMQA